jgi:two-component system sensor histidine kinase UhpB
MQFDLRQCGEAQYQVRRQSARYIARWHDFCFTFAVLRPGPFVSAFQRIFAVGSLKETPLSHASSQHTPELLIHRSNDSNDAKIQGTHLNQAGDELYRFLMENTHDIVSLHDADGRRIYVSSAITGLLGTVPDGTSANIHSDDVRGAEEAWKRVLAGERMLFTYRHLHADGSWRWLETTGSQVLFQGNRRVLAVTRDVTVQRQAAEALKESERKLKLAVQIAHIGYWELDISEGRITWSQEIYRILGLPPQKRDIKLDDFRALIHPEDLPRHIQAIEDVGLRMEKYELEYRIIRPDGEIRFIHSQGDITRDESGRPMHLFGIAQDITPRKLTEEALRDSADRLHHLNRRLLEIQENERRHMARELHDEFGQLLATIGLHLHAAKSFANEAAKTPLDQCAALLQQAGHQVRCLALELRPTMLETAGLKGALKWLADQYRRQAAITLRVAGNPNDVSSDVAIAVFRVAQEALTNITRHAKAKHVSISLDRAKDFLELVVRDDGEGFNVAKTVGTTATRGKLGLLGMKERVELFRGSLELISAPGEGTMIRAVFPAVKHLSHPHATTVPS